jgi:hypothetical protein
MSGARSEHYQNMKHWVETTTDAAGWKLEKREGDRLTYRTKQGRLRHFCLSDKQTGLEHFGFVAWDPRDLE